MAVKLNIHVHIKLGPFEAQLSLPFKQIYIGVWYRRYLQPLSIDWNDIDAGLLFFQAGCRGFFVKIIP